MHFTVDSTDDPDWKHNVGLITTVADEKITSAGDAIAIVCGPPVVIRFMQPILEKKDIKKYMPSKLFIYRCLLYVNG